MNKDIKDIKGIQKIMECCELKTQMEELQEKFSKLNEAVFKYLKYDTDDTKKRIAEEMAEVEIWLNLMKCFLDLRNDVQAQREYKMERAFDRIKRNRN